MKYIVEKTDENLKLMYYNRSLVGLDITPKGKIKNLTINAKKIIIVDNDLVNSYVKTRINRKIDKIIKFMIRILDDEDTTDEDTSIVLDEIERLKTIVMNKYKEYLKESEYRNLLTKIILIEEEFKRNYNQRLYENYENYIIDDYVSGMSR